MNQEPGTSREAIACPRSRGSLWPPSMSPWPDVPGSSLHHFSQLDCGLQTNRTSQSLLWQFLEWIYRKGSLQPKSGLPSTNTGEPSSKKRGPWATGVGKNEPSLVAGEAQWTPERRWHLCWPWKDGRNLSSGEMTIEIKLYHYFLTHILYQGWGKEDVLFKVSFPLITTFTVEMWKIKIRKIVKVSYNLTNLE